MTELNKLKTAAKLIENTTGCRFTNSGGGSFIDPDKDSYLAINMRKKYDYSAKLIQIQFGANLRTLGCPMDAEGLSRLDQEVSHTLSLLRALEKQKYT